MFKLTFPIPCLPLSVKGLPERITSRKKNILFSTSLVGETAKSLTM